MSARSSVAPLVVAVALACARRGSDDAVDTTALIATPGPDTAAAPSAPGSGATGAAGRAMTGGTPPPSTPRPPVGGAGAAPSQRPPGQPAAAAPIDSARGVAAVVGSVPVTSVVVRPSSGPAVTVTGPLAAEIGRASGADVWVRGRRVDARTIEVTSYAVRSVDGVSAVTGTLTAEAGRLVLVTDDGRRHTIARPPASLREHVGARIWISGDLDAAITAYGVLRPGA